MRITISGTPGSGKSTAAQFLIKEYGLKHYSMGDFQRQLAKEKGITINELSKLEEKDDSIDRMVDEKQRKLGVDEDNFVIDSRMSACFIPQAELKIFVDCDFHERARRVFEQKRDDEKGTLKELEKKMMEREESEVTRFKEFYNFDYQDPKNYDLVIDTTKISPEEVVRLVKDKMTELKII